MSGAVTPASSMRCLISGTARAASSTLTVMRTISEPAWASSMHCFAVPAASAVSVLVIDCTTTGAPPPTVSAPMRTPTVAWRGASGELEASAVTGKSYQRVSSLLADARSELPVGAEPTAMLVRMRDDEDDDAPASALEALAADHLADHGWGLPAESRAVL